jgi:hypothetical protein
MLSLENDASRRWRVKLACSSFLLLIALFLITMWMTTPEIKTDPFLLNQENWPVTVEEAVHDILPRITPYEKLEMMVTNKDHLNSMHFGLGLWIRNRYGLWRGNDKLILSACGLPCHSDDASGKILEAVWQVLHR